MANLTLRWPEGDESSPLHAKLSVKEFHFPENNQKLESLTFEPGAIDRGTTLKLRVNGTPYRVARGYKTWEKGCLASGPTGEQPVAASGAWTPEGLHFAPLPLRNSHVRHD